MKRHGLRLLLLGFGIMLLAGCGEVEELLGKVNQMLDETLNSDESEEATTEEQSTVEDETVVEENTPEQVPIEDEEEEVEVIETAASPPENEETTESEETTFSDGHENEADPELSFEEKFALAGYTAIDPPNGLRVSLPLDWVLIQEIKSENPWEGGFCFPSWMDETIAEVEASFQAAGMDVISDPIESEWGDNVHSTKFSYEDMNEKMEGDIIYFPDNYGMNCATVYVHVEFK